jgi:hypothetical protein
MLKFFPLFLIVLLACNNQKKVTKEDNSEKELKENASIPGMPAVIYKTNRNYYFNVPVGLSEDKQKIVSYPAPSDVKTDGEFNYPKKLKKGYLLDNMGIGSNVAFLSLTFEEYAELEEVPSVAELMKLIIDDDPLTEICFCGIKYGYHDIENDLNKMILEDRMGEECNCLDGEQE